jgi:hypothetical protein
MLSQQPWISRPAAAARGYGDLLDLVWRGSLGDRSSKFGVG